MTPQERELIADLFDRLEKLESMPRDPEAVREIQDGLARLLQRDGLTLPQAVGVDAKRLAGA